MKIIFYADIFLALNVTMNMAVLRLLTIVTKRKVHIIRRFAAALLGACEVLILYRFFIGRTPGGVILAAAVTSFTMVVTAFGMTGVQKIIKLQGLMLLITYLLGGIAGTVYSKGLGVTTAVLSFAASYVLAYVLLRQLTGITGKCEYIYGLHFFIDGADLERRGFLDTGNCLFDPVYGYPVIIAETDRELDTLLDAHPERYQAIPYRTIGCESKLMRGIRPDYIEIETGREVVRRDKVIIALSEVKLSNGGEYSALLHSGVL